MKNKSQVSPQGPEKVTVMFMLFSIVFCVCLITANILETKQIVLNIGPWSLSLTGGWSFQSVILLMTVLAKYGGTVKPV